MNGRDHDPERGCHSDLWEEIPFVDAHVHFWAFDAIRYPWLTPPFAPDGPNGDVSAIATPYLPSDYRSEAHGYTILGAVHVEAGAHGDDAIRETDWLNRLADETGLPNAIVAHARLDADDINQQLAEQAKRPRVRGIRHIINWHSNPALTYTDRDLSMDAKWRSGFASLAQHDLSFDCQAYPHQFAALADLFAQHDSTQVMINHAGMGVDGEREWLTAMSLLAQLPQISVKLSGFGFAVRPYDAEAIAGRVAALIDLFGPDRLMLASDFPTDRLFAPMDATLTPLFQSLAPLRPAQRQAIAAGTANRVYRLELPLETPSP